MTKPPTSFRSIRLPDDLWEQIASEAEKRGTSVNGLVSDFVIVGLHREAEAAIVRPAAATPKAAKVAAPIKARASLALLSAATSAPQVEVALYERKAFNPQPKTGKKK